MSVCLTVHVAVSHKWITAFKSPLARVAPSELSTTLETLSLCSSSVCCSSPVATSHIPMVSSRLALMSVLPSPLKTRLLTPSVWPSSVFRSSPVSGFHRRMVSSLLPLASTDPSELKTRLRTLALCLSEGVQDFTGFRVPQDDASICSSAGDYISVRGICEC